MIVIITLLWVSNFQSDNITSGPGGNSVQGSGSSSNAGAVASGVIVCLLVVGVAAAVAIVLVVLLLRRRQGQKSFDSGGGFDNQLYERQIQSPGGINGKSINLQPVGDTKDDMGDGGPHDYAAIPADDANYEDMNVSLPVTITHL